ncbi:MAG: hypothetical protein ACOCZ6_05770, partial [Nanoarchaeota archaeon]
EVVFQARAGWENPIERKIKSIIIAQIGKHLHNVTSSFKERLGSRIITLEPLDEDEMQQIVEKRLKVPNKKTNLVDKFSDEALSFIIRCSGNNPRRMLEYIDELFEFHHNKFGTRNPLLTSHYRISYYGAKEILGLDKVQVEGFIEKGNSQKDNYKNLPNKFTDKELKFLKFIDKNPCTISEAAKNFRLTEKTTWKHFSSLNKKGGIVFAGKKGRKKRWQISPATKRELVKV